MKRLLLVFHSQSGRTAQLAQAVAEGAASLRDEVTLRIRRAPEADIEDLLWAEGLLLGTPENFGHLSGLMKDFLDRTYYPAEGKTIGLPWALFVSAGNDGRGAVTALERIALGYQWKKAAEPVIVNGEPDAAGLSRCSDLGQTLAAGLALGLF
ncbi:MAG: NAD(P)H-dependent oxidoreductase [Stagnimonas sp.]|nr:NAD(P)H-dependent oxidoreductase [Stagnimonas sp.]